MDKEKIKESAEAAFDKKTYEDALNRMASEKDRLEQELRREYRNARHYVRSHPEQGVGISFLGGLVVGFIIAKVISD